MRRAAGLRRPGRRRWFRKGVYAKFGLLVVAALVFGFVLLAGGAYLRLAAGPYSLSDYSGRVAKALAHRLGSGWQVRIRDTALELNGLLPAVRADGLEIRNAFGVLVVSAPYGLVSLDPVSLLTGSISPREIELRDLKLRGVIGPDGSIVFAPEQRPPEPPPVATTAPADRSPIAIAVASLLDPIVRDTSLIGALDRATIVDASLVLMGPDGTERAAFGDVDATFERLPGGDRRIKVALTGQHGTWTIEGRVGDGPDRKANLAFVGIPLADAALLAGSPQLPAGSDLGLSAQLSAVFEGGRLARLGGRFQTSAGRIGRAGRPAIPLDRAEGVAEWDEAARILRLSDIEVASEGTSLRAEGELRAEGGRPADGDPLLDGDLRTRPDPVWKLRLAAREIVVAGLTPREAPFGLERATLDMSFRTGAVLLDGASVRGPGVDLKASGAVQTGADGPAIRGTLDGGRSDLRRLIRLWPDGLNPDLRAFLAERVGAGTVERLRIGLDLSGPDLAAAFSDAPFTDKAMSLDFALSGMSIGLVEGLPPLSSLAVDGKTTGTRITLAAPKGRIDVGDGRIIALSEGSFRQEEVSRPDSVALIDVRLESGVDAIAALLRLPGLKGAGLDLDPASIRGRADLRLRLPLMPKRIPAISDLPISITGRLADVAADKLPGKEKLDGGSFLVAYDTGAFTLRGDAKAGGSPVTIDIQGSRGGTVDAAIALTLDDAARTRRGLPAAPVLAGPVPVKIAASFPQGARAVTRIEADLTRAAIDGLIPGWTKPAGRPGRLAFSPGDGDTPELRDLVVDAGSVQIRGSLAVSAAGSLERADLTTFKLSPGDDMRVQAERGQGSVVRVNIRGNNGDARPILRWISAPPAKAAGSREQPDLDLDLTLSILSGHNDEAMTGVSGRVTTRGGEVRSLSFSGRFRDATLEAQLAKRDSGAPILTLQSRDAGATLRFFDVYRRMVGGRMAIEARSGEGVQDGRLTIDSFGLRNEPALLRIASQGSSNTQGGNEERGLAPVARSDLDQVLFNRLSGDFRRVGGRIDVRDVVIYGSQVGFTLAGMMDFPRDRMDITGTFVPAYMLNNAFGQVPVVGLLLGGGRNEGLFAVDFRVVGQMGSPNLTVNPLTAVAPGILRKLFGWMLNGPETIAAPAAPSRSDR